MPPAATSRVPSSLRTQTFSISTSAYRQVLGLNLGRHGAAFARVRADLRGAEDTAIIVNFSSMAAAQAITRVVGYSNAKAAVDNLTKWLAVEIAHKFGAGCRVNAIAPGFFVADQNRRLLLNEDGTPTARGQSVLTKTPFKRFGEAHELHGALHFLLSDASAFVTGTVHPGGRRVFLLHRRLSPPFMPANLMEEAMRWFGPADTVTLVGNPADRRDRRVLRAARDPLRRGLAGGLIARAARRSKRPACAGPPSNPSRVRGDQDPHRRLLRHIANYQVTLRRLGAAGIRRCGLQLHAGARLGAHRSAHRLPDGAEALLYDP
jgi:hypothetical protein